MAVSSPTSNWWRNRALLLTEYQHRNQSDQELVRRLQITLQDLLTSLHIKGQVYGRVKQFEEFYRKLLLRSNQRVVEDPFAYITDLIGLRIVAPFLEDLIRVEEAVRQTFVVREVEHKSNTMAPGEFGYDATHALVVLDPDLCHSAGCPQGAEVVAEIQIRTILQNAWAEVEHELVYKASLDLVDPGIRRKLLAMNATLSLADTTLQEIREHQRRRYRKLLQQNRKLMEKVSTLPDLQFEPTEQIPGLREADTSPFSPSAPDSASMTNADLETASRNDMVIEALEAHLRNDLDRAIELYSALLAANPNASLFNHRGLAFIAQSRYEDAIVDFSNAIEIDAGDRRAYTNRGLALRMVKRFSEALADFDRSVELNPVWPDTFYGRALTHYDLGEIGRATEDCDRAIAIKPDFKQVIRFKKFLQNLEI